MLRNVNIVKTFAGRFGIGQWSFIGQVLRKSEILQRIVHKEPGTILRRICYLNLQKADIPSSMQRLHVKGSIEKQRTRKVVYTVHR